MSVQQADKPVVALAMGDPAGISPELTAKLAAQDEIRSKARLIVIGDRRVFDAGAAVAGVKPELKTVGPDTNLTAHQAEHLFIDLGHLDPASIERGVAAKSGGEFALENYR